MRRPGHLPFSNEQLNKRHRWWLGPFVALGAGVIVLFAFEQSPAGPFSWTMRLGTLAAFVVAGTLVGASDLLRKRLGWDKPRGPKFEPQEELDV